MITEAACKKLQLLQIYTPLHAMLHQTNNAVLKFGGCTIKQIVDVN